jgi:prephenate dehydrogenase
MLEKITIIGTGLMGGSLSLALRQARAASVIAAYDTDPAARDEAGRMGLADEILDDAQEACRGAEVVFIATPIRAITEAVAACSGALAPGTVVSDLASTKMKVIDEITAMLPPSVGYVGGHPMTGSEQSGVCFAAADMFDMRYYILTPTDDTDPDDLARIHALLTSIGARVISMDPESHDRAMATVSHVPHMLSLLLMELASREQERTKSTYRIAAGGFRDMTRIAASSPDMWLDIARENRAFIVERLKEYGQSVAWLLAVLEDGDDEALRTMFVDAAAAREELMAKSGIPSEELYSVSLPVPDEPGVISRITTAVGSIGINIEDISITHPLEGETGILALKVLGEQSAAEASAHLRTLGYRATTGKV